MTADYHAHSHLSVDFLWDGVLLDPGVDQGQLLTLILVEPWLERLKQSQLLPVLSQYLILVPGGGNT